MDTNDNKQLEEHIKSVLNNYSVPYTEEDKNAIIREFENIKHHRSNFNISFKETIQNKTLHFVIIAILSVAVLIYILTKVFPADSRENHSDISSIVPDTTDIQEDTAVHFFTHPGTVQNNTSTAVNTVVTSNAVSSHTTMASYSSDKNNSVNTVNQNSQKKDTLQFSSNSTSNNNIPEKPIKKKKRRKNNTDNNNDIQDNSLPVLEPKTPTTTTDNVKEEE